MTTLTAADQRGIGAALACSARHHPQADHEKMRRLAEKIGTDALTTYDAVVGRPFDRFDLSTYAGRLFRFKRHEDASFHGVGPWVLAEGETGRSGGGSCAVRFVPAPGGFAYSQSVIVWPSEVPEYFDVTDDA